jgi:hypothetical protein
MRKRHVNIFILIVLLLTGSPLYGDSFLKTGTVGYTFLEIPATSRQAALGEAVGTISDGGAILSLFANPAMLGFQEGWHFGSDHSFWIADIRHHVAGLTLPAGVFGNLGLGVNVVNFGDMIHTNIQGERLGHYSAQSLAIGLTWSRRLTDKFSWGLRVNGVQEQIHTYSSQNILVDMGVYYMTGFRSLRIAGYINHFGVDSRFIRDSFKMPTVLRLGMAYDLFESPAYCATLAVELSHSADNLERLHLALEHVIMKDFYVRSAFKTPVDEDFLSLGAGLIRGKIRIDAGVIPFGRFPAVYSFGIQVRP